MHQKFELRTVQGHQRSPVRISGWSLPCKN